MYVVCIVDLGCLVAIQENLTKKKLLSNCNIGIVSKLAKQKIYKTKILKTFIIDKWMLNLFSFEEWFYKLHYVTQRSKYKRKI